MGRQDNFTQVQKVEQVLTEFDSDAHLSTSQKRRLYTVLTSDQVDETLVDILADTPLLVTVLLTPVKALILWPGDDDDDDQG